MTWYAVAVDVVALTGETKLGVVAMTLSKRYVVAVTWRSFLFFSSVPYLHEVVQRAPPSQYPTPNSSNAHGKKE
jgi:hypothetical protein